MIKFIVGLLVGGFVGTMWMAMACIVDDIDELAQEELKEVDTDDRCQFCGGMLSETRVNNGKEYRYCYSCFHEYEVNDGREA